MSIVDNSSLSKVARQKVMNADDQIMPLRRESA
jgi:hypothetical protein